MMVTEGKLVTLCSMAHGMRVLLQDRSSKLYFKWEDEWVLDSRMAADFTNTSHALHSAVRHRHLPLDIVLKFDDPCYDLRIPITRRSG